MGSMFNKNGTLHFPDFEEQVRHQSIIDNHKTIVKSACCPNGHNLMSSVTIDGYAGIHFIYRESTTDREADIVISAIVGDCTKVYLSGEPFKKGDTVAIHCPVCDVELPRYGVCECGVHDYLFYLDDKCEIDCAQTFCSRIGCNRASKLHVQRDESAVIEKEQQRVVVEGYCSGGHSLMSDVKIGEHKGIQLIYQSLDRENEAEIVISSTVGETHKVILNGTAFEDGEAVCVRCPNCREELPILFNCKCGAPIYMFFLDKSLNINYGQCFCSRVGCAQSSRTLMSQDAIREFMINEIP